ncbi:MAG: efflux transporter periplasmic adaptor subunit [Planctomycetes bacterium]|nr:efflux transporter periplasmic adaptor subunit [Planctomycetota bacterium]
MSARLTVFVCFLILASAGGVLAAIYLTEPEAEQVTATKKSAMLVEVITAERGSFRPKIEAVGTVRPVREVQLSPRIAGQVVGRAAAFEPGGFVRVGEELVTIDPADFENVLAQRLAELHQAEADLSVEMGRQKVAEKDYALLDQELPEEQRALVLRAPQLATARAQVEAAEAAVAQAELDLQRTKIVAPFDALILERHVDLGSQLSRGEAVGRLVGLDTYWVVATVPRAQLRWLQIPSAPGQAASPATVRDAAAWPPGVRREARVDRVIGELDAGTRLARVLVAVEDPLAQNSTDAAAPRLMIGAFVEVSIEGREVSNVVRLDRAYLRKEDTVWVHEDGVLRVRPVEVAFRDAQYVYLEAGLEAGEEVVITDLSTFVDGAALRIRSRDGEPLEESSQ